MNIVIVEDNKLFASNISKKINRSWYNTFVFNSCQNFINSNVFMPNLYIIDVWLPDWTGLDIVRFLRNEKKSSVPILIMSCLGTVRDKVSWLNFWADDYIIKPFSPDEFIARIKALLRRPIKMNNNILKYNKIKFDTATKDILLSWEKLHLPNKEKLILELFILNKGELVTKSRLIDVVWHNEVVSVSDNTINATLSKLRKKLWGSFNLDTHINEGYILK